MAKQKEQEPTKAPKKASKKAQAFARNYYIRGFGRVNVGDEITPEALKAWKAISNADPKTI